MTRGKISSGRAHFSRQFPGWTGPEEIDDVAIAVMPLGAAGRYNDLQFKGHASAATLLVVGETVADDTQRWIPWIEVFHDDSALTAHLRIVLRDRGGNEVTVVSGGNITQDLHISIRRPLIIPEGWAPRGYTTTVTGAGKNLWLRYFYVDVPIGEYVAPL